MDNNFPVDQFLVRSYSLVHKTLYFVSSTVKRILEAPNYNLKVVNTGIKAFSRNEGSDLESIECPFRLQFESILLMQPYIKKRLISVTLNDTLLPLAQEFPKISEFSENTRLELDKLEVGCAVFIMRNGKSDL